jgi:tetratricopeptide (TPR) repeat protein
MKYMRTQLQNMSKGYTIAIFSIFLTLLITSQVWAKQAVIKEIRIDNQPFSVTFFLNNAIPIKIIQVEKKELIVALKNARVDKGFKVKGRESSIINQVALEQLPGDVIAVVLTASQPFGKAVSSFNKADSSFKIDLSSSGTKAQPAPAAPPAATQMNRAGQSKVNESLKTDTAAKPEAQEKPPAPSVTVIPAEKPTIGQKEPKSTAPPAETRPDTQTSTPPPGSSSEKIVSATVLIPDKRQQSKYKGDITDLVRVIDESMCESKQLSNAIILLKKDLFKEAYDVLDQYIFQENFTCLEEAYFLRAYAFLKAFDKEATDFTKLIQAERNFQDALVSYPKSDYVPFGYASIGIIQSKLNNISAAEGYFNIIKAGYLAYSGMPEIMYYLAEIYDEKGFLDKALRYYKQVFEDEVHNNYIPDAGVGYGKALFKKQQYINSLTVLDHVVETEPKKVYTTHEILLHIGNANFEIGESRAARVNLTRVLNLFPDVEGRDVILSKVGDTYGMENNVDKAIKIYELVREKFPDSEGYIASSIGIARYLENDEEKIEIYQMIKNKFPENAYTRIAMMRLAEIYQANGEYNKCIKEIEDLLSTHPRGLRYEAVKLMQRAYEALFKQQLKSDGYTDILNRYEMEHQRIDRMGSRQIEMYVGLSYLEANLYEEAFNHLIMAYKQYKRSERSSDLLFGLGLAMDESGRDDDALKLYNGFTKRFPKSKHIVEVYSRAAQIYLDKNNYTSASDKYNWAFKKAKSNLDKGNILMQHATVYDKKKDLKTASALREKAIKEIALASGENYGILADSYKQLGRTYVDLEQYVKAADSFYKALSFSQTDQEKANIGFLLGDAYQKGNILVKAKEAYEQVVASYDSVWARLAQQRLSTLELAQTVQNS